MSKVALVTDSTAYIPTDLMKGHPIFITPLSVIWGEDTYRDGVDISPTEFYDRLENSPIMPTTSQPSPADFKTLYQRLLDEGHEILSLHISSKLSGTVDSATQAKQMLPGAPIEIIDTETTSMAMGFLILNIAKAIRKGAPLKECLALAQETYKDVGVYFVVNTLEFLHKGGRIGGGAAFLGTLMDLKPILKVENGKIEAVERVRSMKKALDRLIESIEIHLNGKAPIQLSAIHSNSKELAEQLLSRAAQHFGISNSEDLTIAEVSPVIGTHTGPGCVGIAYMTK